MNHSVTYRIMDEQAAAQGLVLTPCEHIGNKSPTLGRETDSPSAYIQERDAR